MIHQLEPVSLISALHSDAVAKKTYGNGTLLVSGSIASANITVAGGTLSLASTMALTAAPP